MMRNRWPVLAVLFLARTAMAVQFQSVGSLGPILAQNLTLDYAAIGTLIGLYFLPGIVIALPGGIPAHAFCFGEDQGRYFATLPEASLSGFLAAARVAGVPATPIGRTGGNALTLQGGNTISLARLAAAHEGFLPRLMGS